MAGRDRQISSFDVFDTVLTRRVADRHALFLIVGRRALIAGLVSCPPNAFADARLEAEHKAFAQAGGPDSYVTLRTIHGELAPALGLDEKTVAALIDVELQVELDMLVEVPAGVAMVASAREAGREIMFVSDMYLPSGFLRDVLDRLGIIKEGETLLVSNDVARSKATGAMWGYIHNRYPNTPIAHCGSNPEGDGRRARRVGIRTLVLENFNPNRYEQKLSEYHEDTNGLSSQLAGASRIARLDPVEAGRQALVDVAAGVLAPLVIGNVLWAMQVAKRQGVEKLFFTGSEGKVLCDVAHILAAGAGYEGELVYIYGNPKAWSLASHTDANPVALDLLIPVGTGGGSTPRELLAKIGLTPEGAGEGFVEAFPQEGWDLPLSSQEALRWRQLVLTDPDLRAGVEHKVQEVRTLVLDYLNQVGVVTDASIGFVDLGTGESLFNSVSQVLVTIGHAPPAGFFFGFRSEPGSRSGPLWTQVRKEERGLGYLNTPGLLTFVKLACTNGHGSVVGYKRDNDGTIAPIFADDCKAAVMGWGLPVLHATVERVAEELRLEDVLVGSYSIDLRPVIVEVFELFWGAPTHAEASTWGAYPFDAEWVGHPVRGQLAARRWLHHALAPNPYQNWWSGGAKRLSGPLTRAALESRQGLRTALPRAKRLLAG